MIITEKGKVFMLGEVISGTSQNGTQWANQTVVLTIPQGDGFKYLALKASGNRVNQTAYLHVGSEVEVSYTVSSRQWNDKWFSNIDLVSVKVATQPSAPAPAQAPTAPGYAPQRPQYAPQNGGQFEPRNFPDDLPPEFGPAG